MSRFRCGARHPRFSSLSGCLAALSDIHPVTIVTARWDAGPVEEWLAHFCGPAAAPHLRAYYKEWAIRQLFVSVRVSTTHS